MAHAHDVGGMHGFGSVDPEDDEQLPFHEAWEARIFGVVRSLRQNKVCTPDEWRHSIERLDRVTYFSHSYYERWIIAAERISVEKGVLEPGQIDRAMAAEGHAASGEVRG